MKNIFDKIKKLSVLQDKTKRNVSIVASGVIFEIIANGVSYLILTRIYSPQEFGFFASFLFVVILISTISTLRYDWFIPNARTDSEAINIFFLCFLLVSFSSMFLAIPIFELFIKIFGYSDINKLKEYRWLAPFYVFFGSLFQVANMWAIRKEYFLTIAKVKFYQSTVVVLVSIVLGLWGFGIKGLILANICSLFSGLMVFILSFLREDKEKLKDIKLRHAILYAKKYFRLIFSSVGQSFVSTFAYQVVPFLITTYFSPKFAGQYFLADRIINLPTIIVGQATFQVFWSEASRTKQEKPEKLMSLFMNFFIRLLKISWIIVAIGILGPFTFKFIFGSKDWGEAGAVALILVPAVVFHFCLFPISPILIVLEHQSWLFLWEIFRLILIFFCFYFTSKLSWEPKYATLLYSFTMNFMYIVLFFISILAIKRGEKRRFQMKR